MPLSSRSPLRLAGAALGLALALGGGCGTGAGERAPNVVLLVLDTVRADHLSCYGYPRPTTPRIDALAAVADRYARVESTSSWTLPSHASIFTGRLPFQHGVHAGKAPDGRVFDGRPLPAEHLTLAEALREAGYRTAGFVANTVYLSETFGFQQGFERYDVERLPAPGMTARLLAWIDEGSREAPFFAFVNYMDAHRPYNVTPLPPERAGALPPPDEAPPGELLDQLCEQVLARGEPADPALVERVVSQYDNGIAWLDLAVGEVVDALQARGLWEDTLLLVTSDHGEYFGEHQLVEHSKDIYEPGVWVPLVVRRPGQSAGRVIEERGSLADLAGLVVAELPPRLRQRLAATFPLADARRPVVSELHFTRGKDLAQPWGRRFQRERAALYAGRYKLILSTDGANELYDLQDDPAESASLYATRPDVAGVLEQRLRALLATRGAPNTDATPPEYTAEQLEELRRLGYL